VAVTSAALSARIIGHVTVNADHPHPTTSHFSKYTAPPDTSFFRIAFHILRNVD
jgi:hypothetical protein